MVLAATVVLHLPSLGQPLVEGNHAFRQTQTAWTALLFHETGIDLFRPLVPVLGPPYEIPFEFPLFQALASLPMDLGVDPDVALRATGLLMFAITAWLVWRLTRRLTDERTGVVALVAFLFTPLGLLWSRTSMIEFLVTAAGLAYILAALEWRSSERARWYFGAIVAGAIAMLVKPTTAGLFLLPILVLGWEGSRRLRRRGVPVGRFLVALGALLAVPIGLGVAWTAYSDAVKSGTEFAAWLTTANLRNFTFGTFQQRLAWDQWRHFVGRADWLLFGGALAAWPVVAVVAMVRHPRRAVLLALAAGIAIGPLVFTNLYFVHDYYLAAISPVVAIVVAVGAVWLWRQRPPVGRLAATALAVVWCLSLYQQRDYWMVQYRISDDEGAIAAARVIADHSDPSEAVVITGRDWDPAALYYARRRGLMIIGDPNPSLAKALADPLRGRLLELGFRTVFDCPRFTTICNPIDIASGAAPPGDRGLFVGAMADFRLTPVDGAAQPGAGVLSPPVVEHSAAIGISADGDGCLVLRAEASDPQVWFEAAAGSAYTLRTDAAGTAQVFLFRDELPRELDSLRLTAVPGSTYRIDIPAPVDGRAWGVRVDPPDGSRAAQLCAIAAQ
ncbi:MAG: hypothetical protein QOH61_104 [Chloroflexota bacterium]|nr:hypothetical protein [Chloroflexota bacterium]